MQQMVAFYQIKGVDLLKIGCICQFFQKFLFTSQPMQSFIPSQKAAWIYGEKYANTRLVDHLLCLNRKLLRTRHLVGFPQIGAKLSSELMLFSFILSQCVKQGQLVCTRDGSQIWNLAISNQTRSFENLMLSYVQRSRPQCQVERFYPTVYQKKIEACSVNGYFGHRSSVIEAMGC